MFIHIWNSVPGSLLFDSVASSKCQLKNSTAYNSDFNGTRYYSSYIKLNIKKYAEVNLFENLEMQTFGLIEIKV